MTKPYGLYVHIPFCDRKCAYCDFLSVSGHDALKHRLVQALLREADLKGLAEAPTPTTLFLGGGSPTALGGEDLEALLAGLAARVDISALREFTVEANPRGLTRAKIDLLKSYGVSRVSLGVQSFDPRFLARLGRHQDPKDPGRAMEALRAGGIENVNLDLIYALPGQGLANWQSDLYEALALEPDHLSLYQLMVSKQTRLGRQLATGELPAIDEELGADAWDWHTAYLEGAGFVHYETSNYARPGFESEHNLIYWRLDDYQALGPGATSWRRPERQTCTQDVHAYLRALEAGRLPAFEREGLSVREQKTETMLMGLRLSRGVDRHAFLKRYGEPVEQSFPQAVESLVKRGLLEETEDALRLSQQGQRLANEVLIEFL